MYKLDQEGGLEFGTSLMQVIGIFWIITGLLIKFFAESLFRSIVGDVLIGIIILAPVWIGAFIAERRKNKAGGREN